MPNKFEYRTSDDWDGKWRIYKNNQTNELIAMPARMDNLHGWSHVETMASEESARRYIAQEEMDKRE